jgi:Protein of unknown function (DUF2723)
MKPRHLYHGVGWVRVPSMLGMRSADHADAGDRALSWTVFVASAAWLSWVCWPDVHVGDSGELGSAAFTLGVAHPTGFTVDMLLLRASALLPFGTIAFRQNVTVALVSAALLATLADAAVRLAARADLGGAWSRRSGAVFGVCLLMASTTFLEAALAVEVYATALLLVLLAARVVLGGLDASRKLWVLLGLACGAHVTAGLLMLPLLGAHLVRAGAGTPRRMALGLVVAGVVGVMVVAYLPLASLRDPVLDWGDPETLASLVAHLTAARIRSAYAGQMFTEQGAPGLQLFGQLGEAGLWLLPAVVGVGVLAVRARAVALVLASVVVVDLAYAVWVNPMGIGARQLGHAALAGLSLMAAVGVTAVCAWSARVRHAGWAMAAAFVLASGALCVRAQWPLQEDGPVVLERHGSASPVVELPPRAVFFCSNDVACSAALFAVYAEGARPDMSVAPAQHLWDATVLRRMRDLRAVARHMPRVELPVEQRVPWVDTVLRSLAERSPERSLWFEQGQSVRRSSPAAGVAPATHVPYVTLSTATEQVLSTSTAVERVDDLVRARFGTQGPQTLFARDAWFDAYESVGESAIAAHDYAGAVAALKRAIALSATRAVAFTNLGVAFEGQGDWLTALTATRRALELEPKRATAWVNLARLVARMQGVEAMREVLRAARMAGVEDARLRALEAQGRMGK